MRLLIDLQGAQSESRFRGIGRSALWLARTFAQRFADRHDIRILLNGGLVDSIPMLRQSFAGLLPRDHIHVCDLPGPVAARDPGNRWRARASALIREDLITTIAPDAVLITSMFEGFLDDACVSVGELAGARPFTAVLHYDLIPLHMPEQYLSQALYKAHYERQLASLGRADLLLTISEHTRQDAIRLLGLDPKMVTTIMLAADPMFSPGPALSHPEQPARDTVSTSDSDAAHRHMVLCVPGGFDPRKNIERLIQAYALLDDSLRARHQLVIASRLRDWQRQHLLGVAQAAGLEKHELHLAGYVGDQDLMALYRSARLFVFPSLHEGFGLPVLEAMACGAPVIGSNITSIPEVIGEGEALFDPGSARSIAETMSTFLDDPDRLAALRERCVARAATFSWQATADRAMRALEMGTSRHSLSTQGVSGRAAASDLTDGLSRDLCQTLMAIDAPSSASDWLRAAEAIAYHHPAVSPRQLFVDISQITETDARTGIQRVVRALLLQLMQRPPSGMAVVPVRFVRGGYRTASAFTRRLLEQAGLRDIAERLRLAETPVDLHPGDIYLSLDLNPMTDAVHASHLRMHALGVQCCFVVYDILPLRHPQWWPGGVSAGFVNWLRRIAVVADRFACISQAVADDLEDWLVSQSPPGAVGRTRSFHLGSEIADSIPTRGLPADADVMLQRFASAPSFLMVGTVEPRKGHAQVLSGFETMWAAGHAVNLVIVGKRGWLVDELLDRLDHHPEAGRRLFWLEGISDEYLDRVYAACGCLIAASEGEGFGLPLIEAARYDIPILARDLPVFREVAGAHAIYFRGLGGDDIVQAIALWQDKRGRGLVPSSGDMPHLSWKESASELLRALDLT